MKGQPANFVPIENADVLPEIAKRNCTGMQQQNTLGSDTEMRVYILLEQI